MAPRSYLFSPFFGKRETDKNRSDFTAHQMPNPKADKEIFFTSGFRSRCTTPWRWQNATKFRICTMTAFASSSEYFPPLEKEQKYYHSLTKYTMFRRTANSDPTRSNTLTVFYPKAPLLRTTWDTQNKGLNSRGRCSTSMMFVTLSSFMLY